VATTGTDRKKALALVALLHLALGAALLHGLAGEPLRRSVDALTTFDVPPPEPPPPPDPQREEQQAAEVREEGATDLAARPCPGGPATPPDVRCRSPPPCRTADEAAPLPAPRQAPEPARRRVTGAAQAAAALARAAAAAAGTGDGGGLGSEARLMSGNLSRGDYRRIRGFGAPRGSAVLAIEVGADGRLTRCLPFTSSGNPALDGELCRLLARTRWEPARDRSGNPVPVALRYVATWDRD
jgi:protein TonB